METDVLLHVSRESEEYGRHRMGLSSLAGTITAPPDLTAIHPCPQLLPATPFGR